jgi:hypothetical protein
MPSDNGIPAGRASGAPAPALLDALRSLADREQGRGNHDTANALYNFVLMMRQGNPHAQKRLIYGLFMREDWERAWQAYDWRWAMMSMPPKIHFSRNGQDVELPHWTGGKLPKTLVVLDEQGAGDTIQFCRFLADLVQRGIKTYVFLNNELGGKPSLRALIRSMGLPVEIISEREWSITGLQAWTAMMDLPRALKLPVEQYARHVPYLKAEPERVARWRERIGERGFRIGIAWQGNPGHPEDGLRSMRLEQLAPLAALEGVRLISLQKGFGVEQIETCSFRDKMETLGPDFETGPDAFIDTAAVMEAVDLVVTVDTSVGHLAGALGRPVHLLLHPQADWRWLAPPRQDTVWYPTMRLYRQSRAGDWTEPLRQCVQDIAKRLGQAVTDAKPLLAPISAGELIDKITILGIKLTHIDDPTKRANVERELSLLTELRASQGLNGAAIDATMKELREVNESLWVVEDRLREHEARGDFGPEFITLARKVYVTNDRRAALKKSIDRITGSSITEEKSYEGSSY